MTFLECRVTPSGIGGDAFSGVRTLLKLRTLPEYGTTLPCGATLLYGVTPLYGVKLLRVSDAFVRGNTSVRQ